MSKIVPIKEWLENGKSDDVQLCEKRHKII